MFLADLLKTFLSTFPLRHSSLACDNICLFPYLIRTTSLVIFFACPQRYDEYCGVVRNVCLAVSRGLHLLYYVAVDNLVNLSVICRKCARPCGRCSFECARDDR